MASRTVLLLTNTVYGDSTYEMDLWNGTWREAERSSTPLLTIVGGQFVANPGGVSQVPFLFRLAKRFQASPVVINGGTLQHGLAEGVNAFAREFPASNKVLTAISVTGIPSVVVDNFAGMRGIVEHVVGVLGRKRPLYISGPYSNGEAQERLRAFRETLQAHNIPIRQDEISEGTWMGPSAVESLRQAMARQVPFDAVVCANDLMALAVVEELAAQGIAVPDKVVVTGFDDVEGARFCRPPLSTVFQPIPELGARAFAMAAQGQRDSLARVPARVVFRATAPESLSGEGEHSAQKELEDLRGLYQGLKRNETLTTAMVRVNRILNQVGGLESLERAVAQGFAECGITDCSIVLLEGPPDGWTGARRIVHVAGGKPQGADRAALFPLTSPLPEGEPAPGKDWLLLPLSFEDQDLGYVVFTRADVSPFVYEALSNVLAGVLHSLLLLDRVRRAETLAAERADRIDELVRPMIASIQQTGAVAREQRHVMEALAKTNTESAERLSGMDSRVTQIRNDIDRVVKLIGSIQEVAETISVIAINASIAAARAGANGRVFGVISAEIRRLSIQTKENTEQIAGVLDVLGGNALGFFESSTETRAVFSRLEAEIQKLLASLGDIQDSMASMDGQAQQVLQTME